ncbi:MAG: tetratricopeptide repeat protein [Thermoanaerobaculales bacterium]|jgi:tetratricopeptide (TPR) repeat protein|nr:tetratricopeptide repeat protein [Thermoanaerobaculales bacterium]
MKLRTVLSVALLVTTTGVLATDAAAAQFKPTAAEILRDDVIAKTVAWRTKSAETTLKKGTKHEQSQPYLTAEAFLMATYSLEKNENFVLKALAILEKQATKEPADPVAEFYRGEVLRWLERHDEAKAAWKKAHDKAAAAVAKNSKNCTARYYLGAALVRMKKADEARKALKKAARDDFDPVMVDFQIGLTYLMQKNWKAAKSAFDDVHEIDPRFAHLYFFRGIAAEKLGQKAQLLNDFDQFVKLAPNSPEAKQAKAILSSVR